MNLSLWSGTIKDSLQKQSNFGYFWLLVKGLCHGQKCLDLFSDFQVYHEQKDPIPNLNGSLDIVLSNALIRALGDALFRPSTQQNRR